VQAGPEVPLWSSRNIDAVVGAKERAQAVPVPFPSLLVCGWPETLGREPFGGGWHAKMGMI